MKTLFFLTILFAGLVAGLLYSYSCSVNAGLKTLPDTGYIKAMQAINIAIQNPLFFISFMGLLLLFPITAYQLYRQQSSALSWMVLAMLIYFIGVFGITVFCNVPLNNQLAKFPLTTANAGEIVNMRQAFEKPWNTWHTIRTIAAIISFGTAIISLIKQKW